MKKLTLIAVFLLSSLYSCLALAKTEGVRIKDLCHVVGVRDNALVGYGIVAGLAGTGDSSRSRVTTQSIANLLDNFGLKIDTKDINSRNVASVTVSATLPPFARNGDKFDVNVTSIGDARSLLGGVLLLTHLKAADGRIYALSQGPLVVGGYKYDQSGNVVQKNHPTSAVIPGGATAEEEVETSFLRADGSIQFKLNNPDFTTAARIANELNRYLGADYARALDPGRIAVQVSESGRSNIIAYIMGLEKLMIEPDSKARIVINERTGTVVSGGDVQISKVSISHGDLKLAITTDFLVSQPFVIHGRAPGVSTQVVPDTKVDVTEEEPIRLSLPGGISVDELIAALRQVKTSSRDIITILQGIKRAGALHAELIVQ